MFFLNKRLIINKISNYMTKMGKKMIKNVRKYFVN